MVFICYLILICVHSEALTVCDSCRCIDFVGVLPASVFRELPKLTLQLIQVKAGLSNQSRCGDMLWSQGHMPAINRWNMNCVVFYQYRQTLDIVINGAEIF